jgi:hypothetical protein
MSWNWPEKWGRKPRCTRRPRKWKLEQLILRTRLSTQKEVEELIRKAGDEIQKVLADIRVIRITAQEELAAQRKFTDAAKIATLSLSLDKEQKEKARSKKSKQTSSKK